MVKGVAAVVGVAVVAAVVDGSSCCPAPGSSTVSLMLVSGGGLGWNLVDGFLYNGRISVLENRKRKETKGKINQN